MPRCSSNPFSSGVAFDAVAAARTEEDAEPFSHGDLGCCLDEHVLIDEAAFDLDVPHQPDLSRVSEGSNEGGSDAMERSDMSEPAAAAAGGTPGSADDLARGAHCGGGDERLLRLMSCSSWSHVLAAVTPSRRTPPPPTARQGEEASPRATPPSPRSRPAEGGLTIPVYSPRPSPGHSSAQKQPQLSPPTWSAGKTYPRASGLDRGTDAVAQRTESGRPRGGGRRASCSVPAPRDDGRWRRWGRPLRMRAGGAS
eukprot:COSAG01_NODE_3465_length_6056_cov_32.665268_6_plen_254_part_00